MLSTFLRLLASVLLHSALKLLGWVGGWNSQSYCIAAVTFCFVCNSSYCLKEFVQHIAAMKNINICSLNFMFSNVQKSIQWTFVLFFCWENQALLLWVYASISILLHQLRAIPQSPNRNVKRASSPCSTLPEGNSLIFDVVKYANIQAPWTMFISHQHM